MSHDLTKTDLNRRELNFLDRHSIKSVLPEYFVEEYPLLIKLLEYYYDYSDSDISPHSLIHDLFSTRDIEQVDESLLKYIEDELLLGQNYFKGFENKRTAAYYSNTLYRSKGTLYSIQQFFRAFFGISPDVVYTKNNVFIVGESRIGSESFKYITDDKLYQTYAILVKAPLPLSVWKDVYKLFVHPAGMYLGAEIQIVSSITGLFADFMPDSIPSVDPIVLEGIGYLYEPFNLTENSGIIDDGTGTSTNIRITLPGRSMTELSTLTLGTINGHFDTLGEIIGTNSQTFDEDNTTDSDAPKFSFDVDFDTFDEDEYSIYD